MGYEERRNKVFEQLKENSVLILFSGVEIHVSADEYAKFEVNKNFFYLTGLRRENMVLVMTKRDGKTASTLYIEEADPYNVRWFGKKVSKEEATEISGIENVKYMDEFESSVNAVFTYGCVEHMYFDCYRESYNDLPDYNLVKAQEISKKYTGIEVMNVFPMIASLRMEKDEDEIKLIKEAVQITKEGLENVMINLQPGIREYQAQADFEYVVHYNGGDGPAFFTIAGSGANGTMLHYDTNQEICEDGTLLLLDLGAKYQGYCADITRTYPVNGKYTDRQRQVYEIVLKANRKMVEVAKPGMTLKELNEICKDVLAEGCIELGLIKEKSEIGKYYMHGVGHHLGIDVHDVSVPAKEKLQPGCIITDEPGLYIDEWEIGIRIEDDLLITEDGCVCLSEDIIREVDDIEAFMQKC